MAKSIKQFIIDIEVDEHVNTDKLANEIVKTIKQHGAEAITPIEHFIVGDVTEEYILNGFFNNELN